MLRAFPIIYLLLGNVLGESDWVGKQWIRGDHLESIEEEDPETAESFSDFKIIIPKFDEQNILNEKSLTLQSRSKENHEHPKFGIRNGFRPLLQKSPTLTPIPQQNHNFSNKKHKLFGEFPSHSVRQKIHKYDFAIEEPNRYFEREYMNPEVDSPIDMEFQDQDLDTEASHLSLTLVRSDPSPLTGWSKVFANLQRLIARSKKDVTESILDAPDNIIQKVRAIIGVAQPEFKFGLLGRLKEILEKTRNHKIEYDEDYPEDWLDHMRNTYQTILSGSNDKAREMIVGLLRSPEDMPKVVAVGLVVIGSVLSM
jgi:hypothetical protein